LGDLKQKPVVVTTGFCFKSKEQSSKFKEQSKKHKEKRIKNKVCIRCANDIMKWFSIPPN
jgi:uncharacterized protein (DUF4415 family)